MCYHPKHILIKNPNPTAAYPDSYIELDVPCGKCVACLRKRQRDYASRLIREVRSASDMFFVTLTYNNQSLPLAQTFFRVNVDSGEEERVSNSLIFGSDEFSDIRSELVRIKSSRKARYVTKYVLDHKGSALNINGYYYYSRFTPSLFREDVKNWIKGCRVQYKRDFGVNLDFRYAWCGEYGPRGTRPHYHLCFLNLSSEQLVYMLNRWHKGFVYWKEVPAFNPDGTNARAIAANYIAKYVSKGKFDADSVLDRNAQKGRLCNSKRFGTFDFTDEEISYYRAYDLYGKYDIDSFSLEDKNGFHSRFLTDKEISDIVREVASRSYYSVLINGETKQFPLPRAFRIRLFYNTDFQNVSSISVKMEDDYLNYYFDYDGTNFRRIRKKCITFSPCSKFSEKKVSVKRTYRSSLLSRKVSDYLLMLFAYDHKSEFDKFCSEVESRGYDTYTYAEFKTFYEMDKKCVFESMEENDFADSLMRNSKDNQ